MFTLTLHSFPRDEQENGERRIEIRDFSFLLFSLDTNAA
jgi:hypothetical protein